MTSKDLFYRKTRHFGKTTLYLASCSEDRSVAIWDISDFSKNSEKCLVKKWNAHEGRNAWVLEYNEKDKVLYSGGADGAVNKWDLEGMLTGIDEVENKIFDGIRIQKVMYVDQKYFDKKSVNSEKYPVLLGIESNTGNLWVCIRNGGKMGVNGETRISAGFCEKIDFSEYGKIIDMACSGDVIVLGTSTSQVIVINDFIDGIMDAEVRKTGQKVEKMKYRVFFLKCRILG